ncbi:MAG: hypothetical protein ACRD21_01225 [Vicinamibacteria bacterium]
MRFARLCCGAVVALASASQVVYEDNLPIDHPEIRYPDPSGDDAIARLSGELSYREDGFSYLPSLLQNLGIALDSQLLVFSKTSSQVDRISPRTPRAIYFGDDAAVAWVPGGDVIEIAAIDPRKGAVFYTLDARRTEKPRFARPDGCLHCHQGPATLGVPGIYVSSVHTSSSGRPDFRLGSIVTDHRTPFEDRWGGWYVTGTHGGERHRGNAAALDPAFATRAAAEETLNLETLRRKLDASRYLTPSSDIVALMTFEHQTRMTNLFTRLGWEARMGGESGRLSSRIEEVVDYMLFLDEARLREPIRGVSAFTESFPRRGPKDSKGRSLRDFDLETRLFRYPLSYLIYSEVFEALPGPLRDEVWKRLHDRMQEKLAPSDRQAILEILRDTYGSSGSSGM